MLGSVGRVFKTRMMRANVFVNQYYVLNCRLVLKHTRRTLTVPQAYTASLHRRRARRTGQQEQD